MRLHRSTTVRIAALVFLLQLGGAAALLVTVKLLTKAQLTAYAEGQAFAVRDALLRGGAERRPLVLARRIDAVLARNRDSGSVMLLVDPADRRLAGNLIAWPSLMPPSRQRAMTALVRVGRVKAERMRVVATPLPGGARLLTGHVIENEVRFSVLLGEAMLGAVVLAVALAAFATWITTRLIEAKIGGVVETARVVATGDLGRRVPPNPGGDAFADLGAAVNAMLDRIAGLMGELKIATDGLAHDLRSPLTRLRSTLERALAVSDTDEARAVIARAIDEGDRLLTMLDTALRITRAEAGLGRESFVAVDMGEMIGDIAEVYGPVAEELGFTILHEAAPGLTARVHRELLGQTLGNLIDNALKYGAGQIRVGARREGAGIVVSVADRGPGIDAADHAEALRRFGRLDAARTRSGAGLGLPLAAAVARLHGGALSLHDAAPGLRVDLALPDGAGARRSADYR